jgi:hypothetical protein
VPDLNDFRYFVEDLDRMTSLRRVAPWYPDTPVGADPELSHLSVVIGEQDGHHPSLSPGVMEEANDFPTISGDPRGSSSSQP